MSEKVLIEVVADTIILSLVESFGKEDLSSRMAVDVLNMVQGKINAQMSGKPGLLKDYLDRLRKEESMPI